ncbi:hypothetical protein LTR15_007109 [Elasticomyces elasticus]|nr:hypothetical protein LTR15_007109 [Elasticomyces elasticus]
MIQDGVVAAGNDDPPPKQSWFPTLMDLEDGLLAPSSAQTPLAAVIDVPATWGSPHTPARAFSTGATVLASLDNDYKNMTEQNDACLPERVYQLPRIDDHVDDEPANVEQTQSPLYHPADYYPPPTTGDSAGNESADAEQKQNAFHYPPPPTGDYARNEPVDAEQKQNSVYQPADHYDYPLPPTGGYAIDDPEQMAYPQYYPMSYQRAYNESQANSGAALLGARPWSQRCGDLRSNVRRDRDLSRGIDSPPSSARSPGPTPTSPPETIHPDPVQYLHLADGQFRLLRLLTGAQKMSNDGRQFPRSIVPNIRGYLRTFTLGASPAYRAVSYVWGAQDLPARSRSLYGEAQTMAIALSTSESRDPADFKPHLLHSANLYELLCQLATEKHDCWLWIDGLCINQADNVERSQQIKSMGLIYQTANIVLSWLGRAVDKPDYDSVHPSVDSSVGSIERTIARLNEYDASGKWLTKGDEVIPEIKSKLMEAVERTSGYGRKYAEQRLAKIHDRSAELDVDPVKQRELLAEFTNLLLTESDEAVRQRHLIANQFGMALGHESYFNQRQSSELRSLCGLSTGAEDGLCRKCSSLGV